ncbi:MAG: PAS domain S-box protein, partial [Candidatus Lokiarchaeota archaeon]|nr:PAS domain S-box protein [Candidatus Lokiarchaeota archaeon]
MTYEDISIRKFSEQKLKESEEKNRGLINNITDIIYELDINGKCTYVSNQLFEISGFHPEEMIGHNMFQYLHPEDFSSITEKVKEVFNSGLRVSADFRLRHKDGQYIPVSSNFNVIRINDQERFTGVLRDNTEKKKAELKLRESEEKYRTIFNSSPDYIFITDVEGIILDMNLALLKRIGMTLDEVRGKNFAQFYAGDNLDELLLVRDDIKAGKEIMGSEVKARAKTGEIFEYEVNSVPIKENGKVVKVINLARDVTDKKIAEQKLKESELKYRHLFEKSPYSIILINRKGEIIDCNHATEKIFNNKVEELINRNFLEVVIKSDKNLPLYEQRYRYLLEGVIPEPIEVQIPRSSDGRLIWVSITESLVAIGGETVFQVILQNITEKKIAEQNLKRSQEDLQVLNKELEQKVKERTKDLIDSERQYRTTIDSLGDPLHVVDRDLRIILVNQAFKEWLGDLNIDAEIFGRKIPEVFSFLPPIIYEEYTQVFDTGNTLVTTEITPLPEREITTETRKIPIFHEGKVEQIITIIRDVTERKKAEQKLKEEREKLQNYLDIAGVILLVLNADQTVQLINRKGCEILEEDESEIIGINWIDEYIPENNRELVKKRYNRFINGEIELFENTEAPIITKNGEKRIIAWYNRALKNAEGEIIGSLSSGQDITENKIAEQKLKESEEKFRNMINNLDIGFFRGIYKRELLIYNQAFNRILGLEPHVSMVGADSTQFFADEKKQKKYYKELEEKGFVRNFIAQIKKVNGDVITIDLNAHVIYDTEGEIAEAEGTFSDISEKFKLQQDLLESEKKLRKQNIELMKLDEVKNDFITMAAHELKTPLISISGYTDYILMKHRNSLPPEITEDLKTVQRNVTRLEVLMDQLLDVMKIDENKLEIQKEPINITKIINDCLDELSYLINEKNLEVILNISHEIILNVDPNRIFTVFTNLISNAIKFTQDYGWIEISCKRVEDKYIFKVKDNGIGLTEDELSRLFIKFERIRKPDLNENLNIKDSGTG